MLFDDLNFEHEFALIPRDTYATIPAAKTFEDVPLDRWRELGADAVLVGTVQKTAAGILVQVRLFDARRPDRRQAGFGKEYSGSAANPRGYAHAISDEIHEKQRALHGVARTKLTFASDRDGERMGGTVESRSVKEIYISDYDGANQRRVTTGRSLNIQPNWSPDARSIAYTSYRNRDGLPNIFISHIYQGLLDQFPKAPEADLPAVLVARRDADRVLVDARRKRRDLRRQSRRLERPAADEQSRASTNRRPGARTGRRSRSSPIGPARPRSG